MKHKKVCPICGNWFETDNSNRKYCGMVCSYKAMREQNRRAVREYHRQRTQEMRKYRRMKDNKEI